MIEDLHDQLQKAISMVSYTIEEFDEEEWGSGVGWFQTPARIGWHIVESLDFYFSVQYILSFDQKLYPF